MMISWPFSYFLLIGLLFSAGYTNVLAEDWETPWASVSGAAAQRCAETFKDFQLQALCMKNEKAGYDELQSDFGMPSYVARKAKERCAETFKDFQLQALCMKNERSGYDDMKNYSSLNDIIKPTIIRLPQTQIDSPIVPGYGWGQVYIGATKQEVDIVLGKGNPPKIYDTVYFVNYPSIGVQISYNKGDNKVRAIFFYNNEKGREEFSPFHGTTSAGIRWGSTVEQVKSAYGKPIDDFKNTLHGISMRRLVFDGIDFRYENEKMVRIGIPGK
jgi:hypothetical protein